MGGFTEAGDVDLTDALEPMSRSGFVGPRRSNIWGSQRVRTKHQMGQDLQSHLFGVSVCDLFRDKQVTSF